MDFVASARSYRTAFGFYPTTKDDSAEFLMYSKVVERTNDWMRKDRVHSGNVRHMMHEVYKFAWRESAALSDYAGQVSALRRLLPTIEACHSYITTVVFSLISEESRKNYEMRSKKRARTEDSEDKHDKRAL
jgi:hypothetical protein